MLEPTPPAFARPEVAAHWQAITDAMEAVQRRSPYGYVDDGVLRPCSRPDLLERCLELEPPSAIWAPGSAGLVLPGEVDFVRRVMEAHVSTPAMGTPAQAMAAVAGFLVLLALLGLVEWAFAVIFGVVLLLGSGALALARSEARSRAREGLTSQAREVDSAALQYGSWLGAQPLTYTSWVMGGLVVLWLGQLVPGVDAAVGRAGVVKDAVRAGEVWRLLTGALLHGGWLHLWFNFGALAAFGRQLEVNAGRAHVAVVFLASALGGSLASTLLLPGSDSVGASGGIMGLLGALLVLARRRAAWFPPGFSRSVWGTVGINAAIGVVGFQLIDNAAHAGGLLCGVVLGLVLPLASEPAAGAERGAMRAAGMLAMAVLAAAGALTAVLLLR